MDSFWRNILLSALTRNILLSAPTSSALDTYLLASARFHPKWTPSLDIISSTISSTRRAEGAATDLPECNKMIFKTSPKKSIRD
eukprot:4182750-Amphidinium_carterae.1